MFNLFKKRPKTTREQRQTAMWIRDQIDGIMVKVQDNPDAYDIKASEQHTDIICLLTNKRYLMVVSPEANLIMVVDQNLSEYTGVILAEDGIEILEEDYMRLFDRA